MNKIVDFSYTRDELSISWDDGKQSTYASVWLRDNCQMPNSRNLANGQRLMSVTDFPFDVAIQSVKLNTDGGLANGGGANCGIEIRFMPEHLSQFSAAWLRQYCYQLNEPFDNRSERNKQLWLGKDIEQENVPEDIKEDTKNSIFIDFFEFKNNRIAKHDALSLVDKLGFIIINNVPCENGYVLEVIKQFSYIKETNYGKLFEVKSKIDPINLAYTNLGLGLHTDNPYRDPVPTLQLLHCLENSVAGGESLLADGFKAADILRSESAENFQILSSNWINFRFQEEATDLQARVPMIEVNDLGEIIKIRFNNRSIAPIALPSDKIIPYYRAYRHFAEILTRTELNFCYKMNEGDLVLFDNTRVLHARTEFCQGGSRMLQGAYADIDSLYSNITAPLG